MATLAVGFEFGGDRKPRPIVRLPRSTVLHLELARLVELRAFHRRVRNRLGHATGSITRAKLVLSVCGLANADQEYAFLVADYAVDTQKVAHVRMGAFVK